MLIDEGGWDHGWFLGNVNGCVAVARHLDCCFNGQIRRIRRESRTAGLAGDPGIGIEYLLAGVQ